MHAFTPRELVATLTTTMSARFGCPYIVHFEDNEEVILDGRARGASIDGRSSGCRSRSATRW